MTLGAALDTPHNLRTPLWPCHASHHDAVAFDAEHDRAEHAEILWPALDALCVLGHRTPTTCIVDSSLWDYATALAQSHRLCPPTAFMELGEPWMP